MICIFFCSLVYNQLVALVIWVRKKTFQLPSTFPEENILHIFQLYLLSTGRTLRIFKNIEGEIRDVLLVFAVLHHGNYSLLSFRFALFISANPFIVVPDVDRSKGWSCFRKFSFDFMLLGKVHKLNSFHPKR